MLKRKKAGRRYVCLATLGDTTTTKANIPEFQRLENTVFSA